MGEKFLHSISQKVSNGSLNEQSLKLDEDSGFFKYWRKLHRPGRLHVYLFNITNHREVLNGEKPSVTEVGPFIYEVFYEKINIHFEGEDRVSFKQKFRYHFLTKESNMTSDDEEIYTINAPLVFIINYLNHLPENNTMKNAIKTSPAVVNEELFLKMSVRELLNNGYPDIISPLGHIFAPEAVEKTKGLFSWMMGKNDSAGIEYTVWTGQDDYDHYNTIYRYDHQRDLKYWNTEECRALRHVNGDKMFGPDIDTDDFRHMRIFEEPACRVFKWKFSGEEETYAGEWLLDSKRILLPHKNFDNRSACFLTDIESPDGYDGPGLPPGALDARRCNGNMSVIISKPHFLGGDEYYKQSINGMFPDAKKHESVIDIEPKTGTFLKTSIKLQISIGAEKDKFVLTYPHAPNIIYPVAWYNFETRVSRKHGKKLYVILELTWIIGYVMCGVFSLFGIAAIAMAIFYTNDGFGFRPEAELSAGTRTYATYDASRGANIRGFENRTGTW